MWPRSAALGLLLLAVPAPGEAQIQPAASSADAAPRAGAAVRVRLVSGKIPPVYQHPRTGAAYSPPNPPSSVEIGHQAVEAYRAAAARAFGSPGAERPELELRVSLVEADVSLDAEGWLVVVEHEVRLVAERERELEQWRVRGVGAIEGLGVGAVPRAFGRAAALAVARWEGKVADSARVASWLGERGLRAPPPSYPPDAPTRSSSRFRPGPPRARVVAYLDAGVTFHDFQDRVAELSDPPDEPGEAGIALRAGVSGRFAMAALHLTMLTAGKNVVVVGGDLGAVLRAGALEFRGGGGIYGQSSGGMAPSGFVGMQVAGLGSGGAKSVRLGIEFRRFFGTGDLEDPQGDGISLVFGGELPTEWLSDR